MTPEVDKAAVRTATARQNCYVLFAQVFSDAPTPGSFSYCAHLFATLEPVFGELDGSWPELRTLRDWFSKDPALTSERLAIEYTALFEGRGRIYPNASCWDSDHIPQLLGAAARAALDCYYEAGFTLAEGEMLKVDHIATELLFLGKLAEMAVRHPEAISRSFELTRMFFTRAFITWAPRFFAAVGEASECSSYYSAWARLTKRFTEIDAISFLLDSA